MVSLGFLTAGYLIGTSYLKWQESPISTSSTTRMISMLEFPTVTVCPTMGSTTALNYDLLKAENQSMSEKDRENLKEKLFEIFLHSSHESYASSMLDVLIWIKQATYYIKTGFKNQPPAVGCHIHLAPLINPTWLQ